MTQAQLSLLIQRFIKEPQMYRGTEPSNSKTTNDRKFCKAFFGREEIEHTHLAELLNSSIGASNEFELDLLLLLLSHFHCTKNHSVALASLLVQPWHHLHDRIAGMLEFEADPKIAEYLYHGATYRCENLEYESDYCEFNRKCLFALAKLRTPEAVDYIKKVSSCKNTIIAHHALKIIQEYNFA